MTCHHHWMRNLKPHCVQIKLADGSVVYFEGVGSVHFNPVVNGQEMAPLEFTNVLYVPALCSNLFSVLYLTLHRHFTVCIEQDTMHFIRDNKIAFQAKTGPSTAAFFWLGTPFLWRSSPPFHLPPLSPWTGTSGIIASATTTWQASKSCTQATW